MRRLSAFLAFALCLLLGSSCAPRPTEPNPALWRISDADSTVWLFGTVHVLPPNLAWRTERIDAALASAEVLVLETDIGPDASATFASLASRFGAQPHDRTLAALIGAERLSAHDQRELEQQSRAAGLDPARVEAVRPWLAALQLSLAQATQQGQSADAGVENALLHTAHADGKTIAALETPEQQIRTLADLSPADELSFLRATLRQIKEAPDTIDALDRAWASGDTRELAELTERDLHEAGDGVYDALIARRNAAWTLQIRTLLAGHDDVFVAVGAAHLVGDASVINRLRRDGLAVEGP